MKCIEGVAAILIKDEKIAAFKRNHGNYAGYYEFVGGKIEANESKEEALIRECKEEINIDISIDSFFKTISYNYNDFMLTLHCYLCYPLSDNIQLHVHDDLVWVDETTIESLNWLPADRQMMDQLKQLCLDIKCIIE